MCRNHFRESVFTEFFLFTVVLLFFSMGFFQSDCARNGDLKGNLLVWNSPKHELRQWKDKVTAQKHCSPPIERFRFSSSLRLKNRCYSQTESAFAFKLAGLINYTSIYTIDKIFFIFENVAFSLSLNLEIAYSEKLRPKSEKSVLGKSRKFGQVALKC